MQRGMWPNMPILGIVASSISGNLSTNSYESIATATVGAGGAATVSFTSIPSTYKHLQIRAIDKWTFNSGQADYSNLAVLFNSDTGANYSSHIVRQIGSSNTSSSGTSSQTLGYIQTLVPNVHSSLANVFGGYVIDILDYTNTSKFKTVRTLGGYNGFGTTGATGGSVGLGSTLWQSTAAINRIDLKLDSDSHAQYSSFALYGIKG